jgi:hypothetical protein
MRLVPWREIRSCHMTLHHDHEWCRWCGDVIRCSCCNIFILQRVDPYKRHIKYCKFDDQADADAYRVVYEVMEA